MAIPEVGPSPTLAGLRGTLGEWGARNPHSIGTCLDVKYCHHSHAGSARVGTLRQDEYPGIGQGKLALRMNQGMLRSKDATRLRRLAACTQRLEIQGRKTRSTRK